jgi:dTDP-4-dehydrorhamnose reductase
MKLIIAGGTGLVATELIRQSLKKREITSVIALARKPVQIDGIDSSKLKSVVINDYGEYPDHVKAQFAEADACIWYVFIRWLYRQNLADRVF